MCPNRQNGQEDAPAEDGVLLDQNNVVATNATRLRWREQICEWIYNGECQGCCTSFGGGKTGIILKSLLTNTFDSSVVDEFDLSREVAYVAMNHIDRYFTCCVQGGLLVNSSATGNKHQLQLLSMASLWLAIKLYENRQIIIPRSESTMSTILQLGRGMFTQKDLEDMELTLLQSLQWCLYPTTPQSFVSYFIETIASSSLNEYSIELKDVALYLVELSVLDYFFVPVKASVVAVASIVLATEILGYSDSWSTNFQYIISRYFEMSSVLDCKERLGLLHANVDTSGYEPHHNVGNELSRGSSPVSVTQRM
jgi:hypothetical protein